MKSIILVYIFLLTSTMIFAQTETPPKAGWFFSAEAGVMFHNDDIGRTVGWTGGLLLLHNHLKVGVNYFSRSGPVNPHTFPLVLPEGVNYKGQTTLQLRSDHGAFGAMAAPVFPVGKLTLEIPVSAGFMGAGYFLTGENRITPDGRRVSEWEDELMGDTDAGFGTMLEAGVKVLYPLKNLPVSLGAGVYYTVNPGWKSYVGGTTYYNVPRAAISIQFDTHQ
ncbi:MAG: hypothetical protein R3D00_12035 [Bacteroidia bacterium]